MFDFFNFLLSTLQCLKNLNFALYHTNMYMLPSTVLKGSTNKKKLEQVESQTPNFEKANNSFKVHVTPPFTK